MDERMQLRPVLAGPALARGGRLRVKARAGELVVRAPGRFIQGVVDWCDGSRDLHALASMAAGRWGSTRFPDFLDAMLEAGVLLDESVARAKAVQAALVPPRKRACLQATASLRDAGRVPRFMESDDLAGLAAELDVWTFRVGNCEAKECVLEVLLIVIGAAGSAGLYELTSLEDDRPAFTCRGEIATSACRAFPEPLLFELSRAVLVIAADVEGTSACSQHRALRDALLDAGSISDRVRQWTRSNGFEYVHDISFEEHLAGVCRLGLRKRPIYAGAILEGRHGSTAGISVDVSWEDTAAHAGLSIAKARVQGSGGTFDNLVAWGRSYDPRLALGKAVSELAERLAIRQPCISIEATAAELQRHAAPTMFARYSRRQYADVAIGVAPYAASQAIRWVEGREWLSEDVVWLPADCVETRPRLARAEAAKPLARVTSSGCAADVDVENAIRRALYEVIERDAFARHWLAQAGGQPVEEASLPSHLKARISVLASLGCETFVICTTLGLGPTILVLISNDRLGFACVGCAAAADPASATESAFIEAEFAALARCQGVHGTRVRPRDASLPEHHANVFAQRAFFRRADVLVDAGQLPIPLHQLDWACTLEQRLHCEATKRPAYWVELPSNGIRQLDGRPIRTVRALIPGCIPLAFGHGALPEGMVGHRVSARARFPHPLA